MSAAALLEVEEPTTVQITMPFDLHHSPDLRQQILDAIRSGTGPIILDLRQTRVEDSTGFATLLSAHVRAARAGRSLRYSGADERTRRLLWRARLGRLVID